MPAWLVIFLLFELIIILTNPNERDYSWLQGLRRPIWLTFHIWSPLIRLACYLGIYLSLLLVHNLLGNWNGVIVYFVVLALNELSVWVTCRMRSLSLGTLIGAIAWLIFLILTIGVAHISSNAALGLLPYLIWTFFDHLAQWQMIALNSVGDGPPPTRPLSSYRTFSEEIKRLQLGLSRRRRSR